MFNHLKIKFLIFNTFPVRRRLLKIVISKMLTHLLCFIPVRICVFT